MQQRSVIFVPGKNPKPPAPQHRAMLWRCLLEGVRRASPETAGSLNDEPGCFRLVSWNYLYYQRYREAGLDQPWLDMLINGEGPDQDDKREARSWHRWLTRLAYHAADLMPVLIRWLPRHARATVRETRRYFRNQDNIAYHIREQLKKELRPCLDAQAPVLLIGHSLGSVIAFDTLWELSHAEIRPGRIDLLSIGSPLGMRFVQRRLLGYSHSGTMRYPTNIRRWINLSAVGDITALDRCFRNDFGEMLELGMVDSIEDHCGDIYNAWHDANGLNCHRSYGYLVNPAVGRIVADWWRNSESLPAASD